MSRITPYQLRLLKKFADSQYGDLHVGSQDRLSARRLVILGFLTQGPQQWHSITEAGRKRIRGRVPSTPEGSKS